MSFTSIQSLIRLNGLIALTTLTGMAAASEYYQEAGLNVRTVSGYTPVVMPYVGTQVYAVQTCVPVVRTATTTTWAPRVQSSAGSSSYVAAGGSFVQEATIRQRTSYVPQTTTYQYVDHVPATAYVQQPYVGYATGYVPYQYQQVSGYYYAGNR